MNRPSVIITLFFFCSIVNAQSNRTSNDNVNKLHRSTSPFSWTYQTLDGADSTYKNAWGAANKATMPHLMSRIESLRSKMSQQKISSLDTFSYASAAYLLNTKFRQPTARDELSKAYRAFEIAPHQSTYSYGRLRFLVVANFAKPGSLELRDLGVRLAEKDIQDYDVRYYTCRLLQPEIRASEKALGLKFCNEMSKIAPKRPSLRSMVGSIHFRCWLKTRSASDGRLAKAAYQEFLRIAPANDSFRPQAQTIIKMIDRGKL